MEAFEFDDATAAKVEQFEKKLEDVQADIIKYSIKKQEPVFAERDVFLKTVDKFWTKALFNCPAVAVYIDDEDSEVFETLKEIRVERNLEDPREATVHFDFGENAFFSDKTLTKVFKVTEDAEALGSDDFDFATSVQSEKTKINWKSEDKNLAKKNPTDLDPEDDGDGATPGSFFSSFFEHENQGLASSIGDNLINEFYPRATDYYTGDAEDDDIDLYDDEDDEDEEDVDDEAEIDLEEEDERPSKKSKN